MANHKALALHPFSDLSSIPPLVFVKILLDTYKSGKGKSVIKFHLLRQQVMVALGTVPPPGPATYLMHCIIILALDDSQNNEALSHLLISAFSSIHNHCSAFIDFSKAQMLASRVLWDVITRKVDLKERVLVKIAVVFNIQLEDLCKHVQIYSTEMVELHKLENIKCSVEQYMLQLITSRLYTSAIALLRQFSLQHCAPKDFIVSMIHDNRLEAASEFAEYMGIDMIHFLVEKSIEMSLFKNAYIMVKKYNLQSKFPEANYLYKKSSLRKLVDKGCWDIAESIAAEDFQLIEYLVTIAQEAGELEMVAELCHRHNLQYSSFCSVADVPRIEYLSLYDIVFKENVHWVDTADMLVNASNHLCGVDTIAIDCEWRPDFSNAQNKVSILQIATNMKVFVIDLIKLYKEERDQLETFLKRIFGCSKLLKIGYAPHNDVERLFHSYGDILSFHHWGPVLDLQKISGITRGGLSGLAKMTLGKYLNKASRMSNWEKRPLTTEQLQYAALDAVVLLSIVDVISNNPSAIGKEKWNPSKEKWNPSNWERRSFCFNSLKAERNKQGTADYTVEVEGKVVTDECEKLDRLIPNGASSYNLDLDFTCNTIPASNEDLVYASCDLLGLPLPGLLMSVLQDSTRLLMLPEPVYNFSYKAGPNNRMVHNCILEIGDRVFCGHPCFSKKEAKAWAAFYALSCIFKGILPSMNLDYLGRLHTHVLQHFQGSQQRSLAADLRHENDSLHGKGRYSLNAIYCPKANKLVATLNFMHAAGKELPVQGLSNHFGSYFALKYICCVAKSNWFMHTASCSYERLSICKIKALVKASHTINTCSEWYPYNLRRMLKFSVRYLHYRSYCRQPFQRSVIGLRHLKLSFM